MDLEPLLLDDAGHNRTVELLENFAVSRRCVGSVGSFHKSWPSDYSTTKIPQPTGDALVVSDSGRRGSLEVMAQIYFQDRRTKLRGSSR